LSRQAYSLKRHHRRCCSRGADPWALLPPGNIAREWVIDAFATAGLELPRATMVTTTGVARIALVAKGRFLGTRPVRAALRR
jgi:hypothetical protein